MSPRPLSDVLRRRVVVPGGAALLVTTVAAVVAPTGVASAGTATLCGDGTAPVLHSLAHSPGTLNVVASNKTLTITARVTDDSSGVGNVSVFVSLPRRNGITRTSTAVLHRTKGTVLDGTWRGKATIRRWTTSGTWHISGASLADRAGNSTFYLEPQLVALPAATTFHVTSKPDTIKPTATAFSFRPRTVDTRSSSKKVIVTTTLKDRGGSGVAMGYVAFSRPSGVGSHGTSAFLRHKKRTRNTYVGTVRVPTFADAVSPAKWKATITIFDKAGNLGTYATSAIGRRHWPTRLTVVTHPDKKAPALKSLTFAPKSVSVGSHGARTLLSARASDVLSGTRSVTVTFTREGGSESLTGYLGRRGGTPRNGLWKGAASVRVCQTAGTYSVSRVSLTDRAGNSRSYNATRLAAIGVKGKLTVTN